MDENDFTGNTLQSHEESGSINESYKSSVLGPYNSSISNFEDSFLDLIRKEASIYS